MVAKKKATAKKAAAKKAVSKKAVTKKAAAKKAVTKKAAPKRITAIKEPMTKTAMMTTIAEQTGLSKKDVAAVFESLSGIIEGHVKKNGAGTCTIPGLMKIKTVRKPAVRARKGINPFTGEETMFKAKPARTVVKIQPLKKLKDMAG
jgi:nucleoid DNA-binding protein